MHQHHPASIRRILSLAARATLLAALFAALPLCALAQTLTCTVADGQYVNVRNRPSSAAATWGILHTGDTIEADPAEITDGFFKTDFGGHTAYVSVRYFEIPEDGDFTVEANGRVRVRQSPGGEATGFVKPGKTVHVLAWRYAADGSKWARCTGGSYVSAEYLKAAK